MAWSADSSIITADNGLVTADGYAGGPAAIGLSSSAAAFSGAGLLAARAAVLSGTAINTYSGNVIAAHAPVLPGVSHVFAGGTLTPITTSTIEAALTGVSTSVADGLLVALRAASISSESMVTGIGSIHVPAFTSGWTADSYTITADATFPTADGYIEGVAVGLLGATVSAFSGTITGASTGAVTALLSGAGVACTTDSLRAARAVRLVGRQVSGSTSALATTRMAELAGSALGAAVGGNTPGELPPGGQTPVLDPGLGLTGSETAFAVGAPTPTWTVRLSGEQVQHALGELDFEGHIRAALAGDEAALAAGQVTLSREIAVSGERLRLRTAHVRRVPPRGRFPKEQTDYPNLLTAGARILLIEAAPRALLVDSPSRTFIIEPTP